MFHATIRLVPSNIAALKKALRNKYPNIRSSHADEALAASVGFKSYAAMLSVWFRRADPPDWWSRPTPVCCNFALSSWDIRALVQKTCSD
ncbi:hypothetical protein QO004_003074 [Rhizobium mesoamericanum]|nr:hypothetical protein [Rhizobium mesoamericanum]